MMKFIKKDWGCIELRTTTRKFEVLPRFTISAIFNEWVIEIAFLVFSMSVFFLSEELRKLDMPNLEKK